MISKSLTSKAIDIKGKKYVMVKDRVQYLADNFAGQYSIETTYDYMSERKLWVVKAVLTINDCTYSGLAQEIESDDYKQVNSTSALENCETSAIGRACAAAGIVIETSYASGDEIKKAQNRIPTGHSTTTDRYVTAKQVAFLINKVKWTYNSWGEFPEADEVLNLLSKLLKKEVNKVKMSEMDKAIADIEWWAKDAKRESKDPVPVEPEINIDAVNITEEEVTRLMDSVPY